MLYSSITRCVSCDSDQTDELFEAFCGHAEKLGFGLVYEYLYDDFFLYAWGRNYVPDAAAQSETIQAPAIGEL